MMVFVILNVQERRENNPVRNSVQKPAVVTVKDFILYAYHIGIRILTSRNVTQFEDI